MLTIAYIIIGLIALGILFYILEFIRIIVEFLGGIETLGCIFFILLILGGAYSIGKFLFHLF